MQLRWILAERTGNTVPASLMPSAYVGESPSVLVLDEDLLAVG